MAGFQIRAFCAGNSDYQPVGGNCKYPLGEDEQDFIRFSAAGTFSSRGGYGQTLHAGWHRPFTPGHGVTGLQKPGHSVPHAGLAGNVQVRVRAGLAGNAGSRPVTE
jgi:hypothetical protein